MIDIILLKTYGSLINHNNKHIAALGDFLNLGLRLTKIRYITLTPKNGFLYFHLDIAISSHGAKKKRVPKRKASSSNTCKNSRIIHEMTDRKLNRHLFVEYFLYVEPIDKKTITP